jgi:hypothetical protein
VTIPVLPREDDGVIEVELALALAPKKDANGLIRPNFAGGPLSFGVSFSFDDASSIGALFSGGNGRIAVSVDISYVGKNVDEEEVQVGRRAEIAVCRRAVSLTACMMVESGGRIDSKQILLPRIVPSIPDSDTNILAGSSSLFRLVSLPLLGRLERASGDTTNTIWSRSICGVTGNDDAGVVGRRSTAYCQLFPRSRKHTLPAVKILMTSAQSPPSAILPFPSWHFSNTESIIAIPIVPFPSPIL